MPLGKKYNTQLVTIRSESSLEANMTPEAERALPFVSVKYVLGFTIFFVLLAVGRGPATTGAMIGLCIWAVFGPSQAIRALSLGITIKYLNSAVFAYTGLEGTLAWALLFISAIRVLPFVVQRVSVVLPIFVFSIPVAMLSLTTSEWPEISIMKLIAFTFGALTALTAFGALKETERDLIRRWFFSLFISIIVLSLPTLFFPAIAHARAAEAGFQGILNHPQAFGIFLAPVSAWLLTGVLFRPKKIQKVQLAVVIGLFMLILLSGARTALVTVLLSVTATFMVVVFIKNKERIMARPSRAVAIGAGILGCLLIVALISTSVEKSLTGFVFKGESKSDDVGEAFHASRGKGAEIQWKNFMTKPLTGHGLGIYPGEMRRDNVVEFMGIPISAPVEKGFLPTAILEETGIIGTVSFLILLFVLARRAIKASDIRWCSFFFACIFINIGEVVIFSVGGIGFFFWLLIGLATMEDTNKGFEEVVHASPSRRRRVLYKKESMERCK